MLVIARRYGEELVLRFGDQEASIFVRHFRGDQVKIEVDAPDAVEVWRGELLAAPAST